MRSCARSAGGNSASTEEKSSEDSIFRLSHTRSHCGWGVEVFVSMDTTVDQLVPLLEVYAKILDVASMSPMVGLRFLVGNHGWVARSLGFRADA